MPTPLTDALSQAQALARLRIAQRCQSDLYYLCKHVLGYDLMTEHTHADLCRYAQALAPHSTELESVTMSAGGIDPPSPAPPNFFKSISPENPEAVVEEESHTVHKEAVDSWDPQKNFLLLLMPRGTFKSSVVTIGHSIQQLLCNQDVRILIDSETYAKSKAFLSEIKGHLESNEALREVYHTLYGSYPDARKRDDLWTDSQINISSRKRRRKEPTISCSGVDVTKTGMHYDLIIADDLVSETNITTPEQIEKVKQHYRLALSLLDPGCPLIVIGTRWDYNDIYQHILDNESHRFNILVRRARNEDGSLFFPERLTEEFLENTRRSQGSYLFSCQYMNEPVDNENATFKPSYFQHVPWSEVEAMPMNWILSVDPSFEGEYSDYAALVLVGMNHQRQLYVRHVVRRKMTYSGIIDCIFELNNQFTPKTIVLETIATQKSIQYELVNEQKRRGTWLPLREIRARSTNKEDRIRSLAPFYEYGNIFHIKECPQLAELEYELIHFPKGQHDDVIDALATGLEYLKPAGNRSTSYDKKERRQRTMSALKPRSPLTGV